MPSFPGWLESKLTSVWSVYVSAALCFGLGLFFIFVWSPLPWRWEGFDGWYELGLALARGEPYSTLDHIWGYPYFLAFFYRLFGNRPWVPLTAQALLNAAIPLMIYRHVSLEINRRVAVVAALSVGLLSFNTVYAATQSSDAMCTVIFVAAVLCFSMGRHQDKLMHFAVSGLLSSLAFQFRPNLFLFPLFLGVAYLLVPPRTSRKALHVLIFAVAFLGTTAPWVIRNYRVSGLFVPATTLGSLQLWLGSLEVGPYADNWTYNPRSVFASPVFDYSSFEDLPLVVTARPKTCATSRVVRVQLTYWTSKDQTHHHVSPTAETPDDLVFLIPPQRAPSVVYYYFESWLDTRPGAVPARTPRFGSRDPFLHFVSKDHLGDSDLREDLLDVFDLARLVKRLYWGGQLPFRERLDLDHDGRISERDIRNAVSWLLSPEPAGSTGDQAPDYVREVSRNEDSVVLRFKDDSALTLPRHFSGKITDLVVTGGMARRLLFAKKSFALLERNPGDQEFAERATDDPCGTLGHGVNKVFYRAEPQLMMRYTALALDNIRREPVAYAWASLYRAFRMFVIVGSSDVSIARQFVGSEIIYKAAFVVSLSYLALLLLGLLISLRAGYPVLTLAVPILYMPFTICFVLIQVRHSMTVQPFAFAFIAVAILALLKKTSLLRKENDRT